MSNFDSKPLICDLILLLGQKRQNIVNNNRVFAGKGREDRALILTYLDSPMAEVFPHYCLSFSIFVIFRENWVVKVGLRVQTLDLFIFYENSNPSNFFQCFLFGRVPPLVRILAILDHILGEEGPKIFSQNFENF